MSVNTDDLAYINLRLTRIENYTDNMNKNMSELINDLDTSMRPIIERLGEMDEQVKQHEHFIKELKQRFENVKRISQQTQLSRQANESGCEIV